jgi:hypothetical protein
MGITYSVSGVKRPGGEAEHSLSSNAEFKNCGAIPPHFHMSHTSSWSGADLIKHRDNTGFNILLYAVRIFL